MKENLLFLLFDYNYKRMLIKKIIIILNGEIVY